MSNDDPLLPASRMEKGLPRALGPHSQPMNNLRAPTLSACFQVISHLALFGYHLFLALPFVSLNSLPPSNSSLISLLLSLFYLPSSSPTSIFSYLPPPVCPRPLLLHVSFCPHLLSLLPLSRCPGQKRVCEAFPVQATGLDHTLRGDFCNHCQ